ncbi:MAG: hypothetical protein QME42_09385 [bacterium]|nr:hypothetical protein [bacterium]
MKIDNVEPLEVIEITDLIETWTTTKNPGPRKIFGGIKNVG